MQYKSPQNGIDVADSHQIYSECIWIIQGPKQGIVLILHSFSIILLWNYFEKIIFLVLTIMKWFTDKVCDNHDYSKP